MRCLLLLAVGCGGGSSLMDAMPSGDTPGGFTCANDGPLEPNDTLANAFATPFDMTASFNLGGLAICPTATDKDHYRLTVTSPKGIDVTVQWDSGPAVQVSLLNASGTPLVNGTTTGMMTRACAPNLPNGTYFALVSAQAINNYLLSINSATNCN